VWLCGFLLPVSGVVRLVGAVIAERFLYLPAVGLAMVFGALVVRLGELRWGRWASPAAAGLVLLLFVPLTVRQAGVWKNQTVLFEHILQVSPRADLIKSELSRSYIEAGRVAEGSRLEGDLYRELGLYPRAIAAYERVNAASPAVDAGAHVRLGSAHLGAKHYAEAVAEISQAVSAGRSDAETWDQLGQAQQGAGDAAAAEKAYREALLLNRDHAPALGHLGALLAESGRDREALPLLERHLAGAPQSVEGLNSLALVLMRAGRVDEAIRAVEQAARLDDRNAAIHCNLALAYAAGGSKAAALRELARVRELDAGLALALEKQLR
jgi:tetratricopeptide (TPR) repeat protein